MLVDGELKNRDEIRAPLFHSLNLIGEFVEYLATLGMGFWRQSQP